MKNKITENPKAKVSGHNTYIKNIIMPLHCFA